MNSFKISIDENGKYTLLTGEKYCSADIELFVKVGDGSNVSDNNGVFEAPVFNSETGEYEAVCIRCGEPAIWNHLRGELPEEVFADLKTVGYDLDFVYDGSADDLHMYGKWVLQDDVSSPLGRAAVLDTSMNAWAYPADDKSVFVGNATNGALGYHSRTKILANNNRGYQIYKWENITLGNDGFSWINLWDNKSSDGPTWSFPSELIGKPVDLYMSIRTASDDPTSYLVVYVDRVIAVAYCGSERSVSTDIIEGMVEIYSDDGAKSVKPYAFYSCGELLKVSLPNVEKIGTYSFAGCPNLVDVYLPKMKSDSGASFEGCTSLQHIELPAMEVMSAYAFNRCTSLISVGVGMAMQTVCNLLHDTAFSDTPIKAGTGFIYVPANMVDSYKADKRWKTYAEQIRPASARIGSTYYATLEDAFDAVQDGETIHVVAGTYEALTLTNTERVFKDITVKPVEGAAVTIKGVYSNSGFENAIFENITLDGGTVTHGFKVETYFDGLTFRNCKFHSRTYVLCAYAGDSDNPNGCSFSNLVVENCAFSMDLDSPDSDNSAIMLRPVNGLTVRDSRFTSIDYNAIQVTNTKDAYGKAIPLTGDITITDNTFEVIGSRNVNLDGVNDEYGGTLDISGNTFAEPVNHKSEGNFVKLGTVNKSFPYGINYPAVDNTDGYYYKGLYGNDPN